MKVYHMSENIQTGQSFTTDYKHYGALVEPFVKAMKHSFEMFYGLILSAEYSGSVLAQYNLKGMPTHEIKWATEGIFEYVRRNEFPDAPSRMKANYFFKNIEECQKLYDEDWENATPEEKQKIKLYEVELTGKYLECDMCLFDEAFEIMWEFESPMQMMNVMNLARKYYRGEQSEHSVMEIISEEAAVVGKEIDLKK
ncbi:Protein of unknown function [Lachnospiraceae bacterium XBB1006]|nr:Protein of unknown function [Lachnospiraceae bacterium XBB1006]